MKLEVEEERKGVRRVRRMRGGNKKRGNREVVTWDNGGTEINKKDM